MTKQGKFARSYAIELIDIAQQDLLSAQALSGHKNIRIENVFLLAQQALEKGLKAVLCWNDQAIPFLHDIGVLVAKIEALGIQVPFGYDLNGLSEFATIRRYTEGKETWTEAEVQAVMNEVQSALHWCQSLILIP